MSQPLDDAPVGGRSPRIEVRDLRKCYGPVEAVRGLSFAVERGEVFGLLGPNGAGKTTTVEILEGYRERSGGEVSVLGHDPAEPRPPAAGAGRDRAPELRLLPARDRARGRGALRQGLPAPRATPSETIALVGLEDKADARTAELSGGQRRRLDLALALVGDPELVFLDEPTTGFDPAARRTAWNVVRRLGTSARPSCSPPTTSTRPRRWPTAWRSSRTAAIVAEGPPSELGPASARYRVSYLSEGAGWSTRPTTPPSCCTA